MINYSLFPGSEYIEMTAEFANRLSLHDVPFEGFLLLFAESSMEILLSPYHEKTKGYHEFRILFKDVEDIRFEYNDLATKGGGEILSFDVSRTEDGVYLVKITYRAGSHHHQYFNILYIKCALMYYKGSLGFADYLEFN